MPVYCAPALSLSQCNLSLFLAKKDVKISDGPTATNKQTDRETGRQTNQVKLKALPEAERERERDDGSGGQR